ncbi:GNAT family N-acetyltransferase [Ktedonospora formicarum]|uniref:N-acetyltransferase domain-containing protein n=1 Tax=Ktedonospora formicarum TaxID=2778364 RepID=A0A8J3HXM9_9CHLR|nr:GNAT family N-acetyltransferase [Ktedonospora formicarum]GHO45111.1 hypothetical protein KSX_32740 [Ktedonospora formicarum]
MSQTYTPLLSLSDAHLIEAVSDNFAEEMACFGRVLPSAELHENEELLWFAVSPTFNGVLRSRFASDDSGSIVRHIKTMIAYYKKRHATSFSWTIDLASQPKNLGQHLEVHGFERVHADTIMALSLPERVSDLRTCPDLEIREVQSNLELKLLCEIERIGFDTPTSSIKRYYEMYRRSGFGPSYSWRHFLGYQQGQAVASTSLQLYAGVVGIFGVATLPQARNQGIAASMMLHILDKAEELGYRVSSLSPTEQSERLYQRIGFRTLGQTYYYRWSV